MREDLGSILHPLKPRTEFFWKLSSLFFRTTDFKTIILWCQVEIHNIIIEWNRQSNDNLCNLMMKTSGLVLFLLLSLPMASLPNNLRKTLLPSEDHGPTQGSNVSFYNLFYVWSNKLRAQEWRTDINSAKYEIFGRIYFGCNCQLICESYIICQFELNWPKFFLTNYFLQAIIVTSM